MRNGAVVSRMVALKKTTMQQSNPPDIVISRHSPLQLERQPGRHNSEFRVEKVPLPSSSPREIGSWDQEHGSMLVRTLRFFKGDP